MVIRHRMYVVTVAQFNALRFVGRCWRSAGKLHFPVLVDHADGDDWAQVKWVAILDC